VGLHFEDLALTSPIAPRHGWVQLYSFLPHDGAINVPRPLVNGEGKQGGREMRGRAWDHKA